MPANPNQDFTKTKECIYKNERYSVRDNGAVFRYAKEATKIDKTTQKNTIQSNATQEKQPKDSKTQIIKTNAKKRKLDNLWTFGTPSKNGYLLIGGERVHRIIALAFLGEPPTKEHIVDHIDTNRQNNRPENLRYITKLENALLNPLTREKIMYHCGSIEAFLQNPQILRDKAQANTDTNLQWMRSVTKEEAQNCLKNLEYLFLQKPKIESARDSQGGGIGEWIYNKIDFKQNTESKRNFGFPNFTIYKDSSYTESMESTQALSPTNAKQRDWRTPSSFPLCPTSLSDTPLENYAKALKNGEIFSQNEYGKSVIIESALVSENATQESEMQRSEMRNNQTQDKENPNHKAIIILSKFEPEGVKKYALAKVTFENALFIHEAMGTFFTIEGGYKYFTLAQGLEWSGGDTFDDYC
ncbi:MAG: HNH endonuclease [Helicobacter sp.]|nr:HNH endonuclease [Helicobacter sp.]